MPRRLPKLFLTARSTSWGLAMPFWTMLKASKDSYPLLLEKVAKNELGAKTGKGFYEWTPEFTKAWREKVLKGLVAFMQREKNDVPPD
jgi:3-hydroxyacyl-CoA dehydrogenase